MLCKFYLMIGFEKVDTVSKSCIDASCMIANLDNIKTSYDRVDLGGVIRKCASTFEFVEEAREALINEFRSNKLKASAAIAIYEINNDWTYTKTFECPLDFSTFKYDSNIARIGCIDNSIAALIKANKSTVFEYPVSELRNDYPLFYDGVRIRNEISVQIIGETIEGKSYMERFIPGDAWWWIPSLNYIVNNEVNNHSFVNIDQEEVFLNSGRDCGWGFPENSCTSSYFLECIEDSFVTIDFSNFYIDSKKFGYVLCKITTSGIVQLLTCGYSNLLELYSNTKANTIKWTGKLVQGEKLQYAIFNHQRLSINDGRTIKIQPNNGIVSWNDVSDPIDIDVITPYVLLNRILSSMGEDSEIYGTIKQTIRKYDSRTNQYYEVENERLNTTLIVAAESIRGMQDAKIYTSFNKFCDFMESQFGYVYMIDKSTKASMGGIHDLLNKSVDFEGFTDLYGNITSLGDNRNFYIKFSTSDKQFIGVAIYNNDRSGRFIGYERFQEYVSLTTGGGDYKVREDIYFHDVSTDIYYYNRNDIIDSNGKTDANLHEYELPEIYGPDYSGAKYFREIITSIDSDDSGTFEGVVDSANIVYVRTKKRFMLRDGDSYYGMFENSSSYNTNSKARTDIVFVSIVDNSAYVIIGTSLVRSLGGIPSFDNTGSDEDKVPAVLFKHRDEIFNGRLVKTINILSEPEYEVASDRIYSQMQIGYEKQDYDIGNNGKDEFNFSVSYTTGLSLKDSKLSLLCPYRADCYGFEELAEKRGDDTSSTENDQQTFIVKVLPGKEKEKYILDREYDIAGAYTDTVFNAAFAPIYMIEANKKHIGSFTDKLKFASSEGNSSIVINGIPVNTDITFEEKLFNAGNIIIKTNDFLMPSDWNEAVVNFVWDGCIYTGFLRSVDVTAKRNEALKYELIEKEQSCL